MKHTHKLIMLALVAFVLISCKKKSEVPKPDKSIVEEDPFTVEDFVISLDENPKADISLGKISAKAPDDKTILSYELQKQSKAEALSINASTGELTVKDFLQFDYETNPVITAACIVKAGEKSKTVKITITLKDVIEGFITKWHISNIKQVSIRPSENMDIADYDFQVDWGDGIITSNQFRHSYTAVEAKDYQVVITGSYPGFSFEGQNSLISVLDWGDNQWKTMRKMFLYCQNFESIEGISKPDLTQCTDISFMFPSTKFSGDLSGWDTKNIRLMENVFQGLRDFKSDLSQWNTSNVTNMHAMFSGARSFNSNISDWNTERVTDMGEMFAGAASFLQNLNKWNVDNVVKHDEFSSYSKFTCPLFPIKFQDAFCNDPFIIKVTTDHRDKAFYLCKIYDEQGNLFTGYNFLVDWGDGKTPEAYTDRPTTNKFRYFHVYTEPGIYEVRITGHYPGFSFSYKNSECFTSVVAWGKNKWKSMKAMFFNSTSFKEIEATDQPDLSECNSMEKMFNGANIFNGDISKWKVENIKNMEKMFYGATNFEQNISGWVVDPNTKHAQFAVGSKLTCNHLPIPLKPNSCNP